MTNKRIRLPKEGVVASDDPKSLGPDTDTDVEGHGFVNPAPPADFSPRTPSSGWRGHPDRRGDAEDDRPEP